MNDYGLDLAVIGNGRIAALIDPASKIVWWRFPRFDDDPNFCQLLSRIEEKGFFGIVLDDAAEVQSNYVRHTAILSTAFNDRRSGAVRVTGFAARFRQFGRVFGPLQLLRVIEPLGGLPHVTKRIRPTHSYDQLIPFHSVRSNHIRYPGAINEIRTKIKPASNARCKGFWQAMPSCARRPSTETRLNVILNLSFIS
ncbi:MAG: trehalase-like domain-containing protein [Methylocella sp.]